MKPSEIEVGKTYRNKGAGTTTRTVLEISKDIKPRWNGFYSTGPDEPGVLFKADKDGVEDSLYLRSFASWAGGIVEVDA